MINQGASRISIMLGTRQSDADAAVKYIYQHFFKEDPSVNQLEYQAEV